MPNRWRWPHRELQCLILVVLIISPLSARTAAQVLYGTITGSVRDATGAALPAATIVVVHDQTNLTREVVSNEEGSYTVVNMPQGIYTVRITLAGFREFERNDVPLAVGGIARVDATLEVGQVNERVTVSSTAQLLQTDKAEVSTELRSTEITNLPLNQFRNYQALINLVPGATPSAFQNAETDTPQRSLTTNVNGQNRNNNMTRTDGATNVNIFLAHHNIYVSPAETIDTVTISTNNFEAEQGMAGGAAITVVTKSGTNQFRGSAFGFHNDERFNATPYFFGTADAKPDKLPITRNIYGGTTGGPIRRNHVFFFASYEAYKSSTNLFTFFSVPSEALRDGDFSAALNANGTRQIIYDPRTGNQDGSGRQPFPGNVIPADRIHPIARKVLDLYPLPNTGGTGAGNLTSNYQREELRTTDRHNFDGKVNWNRTASHQIWGKVSHMDAFVDDLTNFLGVPEIRGSGGDTKVSQFTAGQTWTLNGTTIWDATFGVSRFDQEAQGPDFQAGNYGLDVLGIPGTNDQGTGNPRHAGYPAFNTGLSAIGNNAGWNPLYREERTYSLTTNVTKLKGAHEFRAGYLMNFLKLDHWENTISNPRGVFSFAGNATAARGAQTSNFYNTYAAFLLGLVSTADRNMVHELMTTREWQHGLYFRDRWTASPRLTLALGVRWEYYPIMTRAERGMERVDLATLDMLLGGRGGNPKNVGLAAGKDNFAPRLGAIYRVNDDTVVRGGYGVTYNPLPWGRPLRGFYPAQIGASFFQNEPFWYYGTLDQGIPFMTGPDLESGRFPLPPTVDVRTPEPGNVDRGHIQSWNVAVERRLALDIAVDVAYVGAAGDGGYGLLDINAPVELGTGNAGRPLAPMGRFRNLNSFGQRLTTRYQSLQVAINRPFTNGLLLKGAYTLGHARNMSDDDGAADLSFNTPSEYHRNFANAGYDRRHNFQLAFLYELPWRDAGYRNIAKAFISDWSIGGSFGAFTGTPFTVTANGAVLNTPGNTQTADLIGQVTKTGKVGSAGTFYDPSAWAQPQGVRFGNSGRNQFYGPTAVNLDATLTRVFPLNGSQRLEFRTEVFNLTNTPVFSNPNGNLTAGNFMRIGGTHNAYVERQIRLGLRFSF
jgi:hypothetical protein